MAIKSFSPAGFTAAATNGSSKGNTADGGAFDPFSIQDITRRNMDMFNQTMQMFSPFGFAAPQPKTKDEEIADLKAELAKVKQELDASRR